MANETQMKKKVIAKFLKMAMV
jgi:hypothetical protein